MLTQSQHFERGVYAPQEKTRKAAKKTTTRGVTQTVAALVASPKGCLETLPDGALSCAVEAGGLRPLVSVHQASTETAVDQDVSSCNKGSEIAGQKGDKIAHIVRSTDPAQRVIAIYLL